MSRFELLLWALVVLDVLGFGGLIVWLRQRIGALEGTVRVQATTLETVEGLNRVFREVIAALDPERWAKEVKIHKDLAEKKVEAILEAERRRLDQEKETIEGAAKFAIEQAALAMKNSVDNVFDLLPYIPKAQRAAAIGRLAFGEDVKRVLYEYADGTPEPGPPSLLQVLSSLTIADLVPGSTTLEQHPTKGGFNVKPPEGL